MGCTENPNVYYAICKEQNGYTKNVTNVTTQCWGVIMLLTPGGFPLHQSPSAAGLSCLVYLIHATQAENQQQCGKSTKKLT